jgi:hypothetical protein
MIRALRGQAGILIFRWGRSTNVKSYITRKYKTGTKEYKESTNVKPYVARKYTEYKDSQGIDTHVR